MIFDLNINVNSRTLIKRNGTLNKENIVSRFLFSNRIIILRKNPICLI